MPDSPVTFFFGMLAAIERQGASINHSREPGRFAFNMAETVTLLHERGVELDDEMERALLASSSPRFVGVENVDSLITGDVVQCWVFDLAGPTRH